MQRLVRPIVDSIRGPPSCAFPIDSLLHALVDDERLRTGFGLELPGPLLPFGVEVDLQRVSANLLDAQDDRPFVRAVGHLRIQGSLVMSGKTVPPRNLS